MMNITLLAAQAALADTLAGGNPTLTPVSGEAQMNLWDMAVKGGWIMLVLALLSVACFYIFFERLAYIRKAGKEDPLFMERIRDYIRTGEVKSAINYCRITNTPSARMIEKGISRMGRPVADVQAAIENAGNIEVAKLENGFPVIATVSGGAQRPRIRSSVLIDEYFRSHSLKISGKDPMGKRMSGNVYHDFFDVCMNFRKRADFFTTMDSARP